MHRIVQLVDQFCVQHSRLYSQLLTTLLRFRQQWLAQEFTFPINHTISNKKEALEMCADMMVTCGQQLYGLINAFSCWENYYGVYKNKDHLQVYIQ